MLLEDFANLSDSVLLRPALFLLDCSVQAVLGCRVAHMQCTSHRVVPAACFLFCLQVSISPRLKLPNNSYFLNAVHGPPPSDKSIF